MSGLPARTLETLNRNPSARSAPLNSISGLLPVLRLAARASRVVIFDLGRRRIRSRSEHCHSQRRIYRNKRIGIEGNLCDFSAIMPVPRLTVLSAFSGLGGLDLGLEKAGFQNIACIEHDAIARQSLAKNRPNWIFVQPNEICAVARTIAPRDVGLRRRELSLLAGAPVCQPFSNAAQWTHNGRRGLQDRRTRCLTGFFQLVERFLPRVVLIENVPGFIRGDQSALDRVRRAFQRINRRQRTSYKVYHEVVNAADYGVPQRRKRALIVAERDGQMFQMPDPTHKKTPITAWDALATVRNDNNSSKHAELGWLDLLPSIPEGQNYLWHTRRGGGLPLFGYRTRYWSFLLKLAKNRPAWTLAAQVGPYTGPFHWDNRPLTDTELLRLQSFPGEWEVCGSAVQRVRQIGNATPPLLAEAIGRAIAIQFFGAEFAAVPDLLISKTNEPCEVSRVGPIPAKYQRRAKCWLDHPGSGKGPSPRRVPAQDEKKLKAA
jgi:DNA (cytosine-5)-methyltransferase 1